MAGREYTARTRFKVIDRAKHMIPGDAYTWDEVVMSHPEFLETAYALADESSASASAKAHIKDGFNSVYNSLWDSGHMSSNDIVYISLSNPPSQSLSSGNVYHKPENCAYVKAVKSVTGNTYILYAYDINGNRLDIKYNYGSGAIYTGTVNGITGIRPKCGTASGGTWGGGTGTFWNCYIDA